ncbi:hypothetical protein, partial [Trichlorobacter lovleyi]|uniref:hypothetical protein n=1 Tax=Trichlorobacter lovleyi TaxID=313985 RepID=UPI003D12A7DB
NFGRRLPPKVGQYCTPIHIYCNSATYFNDFDQATIELFRFFLPNSTNKFNIIYNYVIDDSLYDSARVAVLAII